VDTSAPGTSGTASGRPGVPVKAASHGVDAQVPAGQSGVPASVPVSTAGLG
jgi:hypothetical protein